MPKASLARPATLTWAFYLKAGIVSLSKKMDQHHLALARLLRKDLHLVALNYASELLLKQVFIKGRCITVNHPKQLTAFKMTAFAKIADIGFYKPNIEKGFARKLVHG